MPRPPVNSVIAIPIDVGKWAHARVLKDASIAVYRGVRDVHTKYPEGDRNYAFVVGVYDDVISDPSWVVVGKDRPKLPDDEWPPPKAVRDKISGTVRVYYKGEFRPATGNEAESLETAAVWDRDHIMERLRREVLSSS